MAEEGAELLKERFGSAAADDTTNDSTLVQLSASTDSSSEQKTTSGAEGQGKANRGGLVSTLKNMFRM